MSILKRDIRSDIEVVYTPRSSSYLEGGSVVIEDEFIPPNPTKPQREQWGVPHSRKFRKIKCRKITKLASHISISTSNQNLIL